MTALWPFLCNVWLRSTGLMGGALLIVLLIQRRQPLVVRILLLGNNLQRISDECP